MPKSGLKHCAELEPQKGTGGSSALLLFLTMDVAKQGGGAGTLCSPSSTFLCALPCSGTTSISHLNQRLLALPQHVGRDLTGCPGPDQAETNLETRLHLLFYEKATQNLQEFTFCTKRDPTGIQHHLNSKDLQNNSTEKS